MLLTADAPTTHPNAARIFVDVHGGRAQRRPGRGVPPPNAVQTGPDPLVLLCERHGIAQIGGSGQKGCSE